MNWEKKSDTLYVRTFGGFSIEWNGNVIDSAARSGRSQFACLMQALFHNGERGVSRAALEEILFGGRPVADVNHAIQSIVYNAKKRLREAGLPEDNYILLNKGVFYWNLKIPVIEDAACFERIFHEAGREQDRDRKLELYLQACECYGGDFLPAQEKDSWAAEETKRYRAIFRTCVEETAGLLRARRDYGQLEQLSRRAAKVMPDAEWDAMLVEALGALEKYEEAGQIYDKTAESCFLEHRVEALHVIQERLEEKESGPGGYLCPYPVFRGIYGIMARRARESGEKVYLMSCTVVNGSGVPMRGGESLDRLSERLKDAICRSVSRQDAVSRYGRGQYLILLFGRNRDECREIQKRINEGFLVGRQRTGVRYYIRDVV